MGRAEPVYDRSEHILVFRVGEMLISGALANGWSVIADATNLTEQNRQWGVRPANEMGCPVLVAFLETSLETAMERSREKERDGSAATPAVYALLNYEREPVEKCGTPYLVINSEVDMKPWADALAKWLSGYAETVRGTVMPRMSPEEPKPKWNKYRQAAEEKARLRKLKGAGHGDQHVHGDEAQHE